jgi:NAD(P)-dependent dehydrogenase (short-subunit alcohol dehydrogenase family)
MFKPRGLAQTPNGKSLHQPAGLLEVMADKQFDPEKLMQTWTSNIPLGRVGEPHEMVGPALFLASDASSMVTGIVLPVDGGFLSR